MSDQPVDRCWIHIIDDPPRMSRYQCRHNMGRHRVCRVLERIVEARADPKWIITGNAPDSISKALHRQAGKNVLSTNSFRPGSQYKTLSREASME
ncbi:MAG: hypothetical protein MI807_04515 [Verrucomicrobiales bacterium]|nr:hypothetical protein [Verrucomicrobiales bacterium]